jgi:hypothetical protein
MTWIKKIISTTWEEMYGGSHVLVTELTKIEEQQKVINNVENLFL